MVLPAGHAMQSARASVTSRKRPWENTSNSILPNRASKIPHRQSGGAVTAILANALDEGLIDAVVTVTEDRWTLKPSSVIITKSDILIQQAGSSTAGGFRCLRPSRMRSSNTNSNGLQLSGSPAQFRQLHGCGKAITTS